MTRYTQRELRNMVKEGFAIDLTNATRPEDRDRLEEKEGYLRQIGYAAGTYGCNGKLLQGRNTGTLYAITTRTLAVWLF